MSLLQLPQELLEHICSFLRYAGSGAYHEGTQSLDYLRRTCSVMAIAARPYLFRHVEFFNDEEVNMLVFLHLTKSRPDLAQLVLSLDLLHRPMDGPTDWCSPAFERTLYRSLRLMTRLQHIKIKIRDDHDLQNVMTCSFNLRSLNLTASLPYDTLLERHTSIEHFSFWQTGSSSGHEMSPSVLRNAHTLSGRHYIADFVPCRRIQTVVIDQHASSITLETLRTSVLPLLKLSTGPVISLTLSTRPKISHISFGGTFEMSTDMGLDDIFRALPHLQHLSIEADAATLLLTASSLNAPPVLGAFSRATCLREFHLSRYSNTFNYYYESLNLVVSALGGVRPTLMEVSFSERRLIWGSQWYKTHQYLYQLNHGPRGECTWKKTERMGEEMALS